MLTLLRSDWFLVDARRLRDRRNLHHSQPARASDPGVTPRRRALASRILATLIASAVVACTPAQAENAVKLPAATLDPAVNAKRATAVLAGGCFWGVEGVFSNVKGVISVEVGLSWRQRRDGALRTYPRRQVGPCRGGTHRLMTRRRSAMAAFSAILFSVVADPTLKNRQGPDSGTQYRAAIVPMDAVQRQVATAYLAQIGKGKYFARPVVVPVESYKRFYRAEANHQDFMRRNPSNGYIVRWDAPKLAALKRLFPAMVPRNARTLTRPGARPPLVAVEDSFVAIAGLLRAPARRQDGEK